MNSKRTAEEIALRDNQASDYNDWYYERGIAAVEVEDFLILKSLNLSVSDNLIDFGCGTGRLAGTFFKNQEVKIEFVGCDISPKSLSIAKESIPHGKFFPLDLSASNYTFPYENYFSKAVSVQVIQHLEPKYHKNAIMNILNAVKEDGTIVLELYNHAGLNRKIQQIYQGKARKIIEDKGFYEYRFTPAEIKRILREIDPRLSVKTFGCQCIPRKIIKRFTFLKQMDILISRSWIGKYIAYYFIVTIKKKSHNSG